MGHSSNLMGHGSGLVVGVLKKTNWNFLLLFYCLTGIIMSIWPNLVRPGQNIDKNGAWSGMVVT